jgi:hypothetical protein
VAEEELGFQDLEGVVAYMHHGWDRDGHLVCYNAYAVFQDRGVYDHAFGDGDRLARFVRWPIFLSERKNSNLFHPEFDKDFKKMCDDDPRYHEEFSSDETRLLWNRQCHVRCAFFDSEISGGVESVHYPSSSAPSSLRPCTAARVGSWEDAPAPGPFTCELLHCLAMF